MSTPIRIGTRESRLAVWQATEVQKHLLQHGFHSELVYIRSEGDINLTTPLYEIGVQGIFTRNLDAALLSGSIDIAVHSMKDVPTQLPVGLKQAAVLKRGPVTDLLVYKHNAEFLDDENYIANIATSSLRRRAQWLSKYPHHQMHNLRGNMQTRLEKLHKEGWDAAIFAQAGLERIALRPSNSMELSWMLPAPAQGAIMVAARADDERILDACSRINDHSTQLCTYIERSFLRGLLGGCTTPIGAYARIEGGSLSFEGNLLSPDGKMKMSVERRVALPNAENLGQECADYILEHGGNAIIEAIRQQANNAVNT